MDMLQNALHHCLKFILKELAVIVLASSLTRSLLLDMYSPVNVLLIEANETLGFQLLSVLRYMISSLYCLPK